MVKRSGQCGSGIGNSTIAQAQRAWGLLCFILIFFLCTDTETQAVSPSAEPTGHPTTLTDRCTQLSGRSPSLQLIFKSCINQHEVRLQVSVNGSMMSLMCRDNRVVKFSNLGSKVKIHHDLEVGSTWCAGEDTLWS